MTVLLIILGTLLALLVLAGFIGRCRSALVKFLKDLFYGYGNDHAELGRILGGVGTLSVLAAALWNVHLGLPIEIDKFGVAIAAVLTASAALVYAKDRARTEARVAPLMADCPPEQKRKSK